MPAKTQICSIKVGTNDKRMFKASKVMYDAGSAAIVGVTPETDANSATSPLYDTAELMRVGELLRISVRVQLAAGKTGAYDIFCARDKLDEALTAYNGEGKTLNGNVVLSASVRRRSVMS